MKGREGYFIEHKHATCSLPSMQNEIQSVALGALLFQRLMIGPRCFFKQTTTCQLWALTQAIPHAAFPYYRNSCNLDAIYRSSPRFHQFWVEPLWLICSQAKVLINVKSIPIHLAHTSSQVGIFFVPAGNKLFRFQTLNSSKSGV